MPPTAASPATTGVHWNLVFRQAVLEATAAFALALLLLGPIVGLVLDGYEVKNELQRPLLIAAIIVIVLDRVKAIRSGGSADRENRKPAR